MLIYTHSPLDLVVLMLGGNDLKKIFNRSVDDIVNGLAELIQMIQSTKYGRGMQSPPKILLVGYPTLTHDNAGEFYGDKNMFENGVKRSKEFDAHFSIMAKQMGRRYFNMAPYVQFSEVDGLHFDEEGHKIFAEKIAPEIVKIIG